MKQLVSKALFGEGGLIKVRAFLTFGLVAVACYMWLMGKTLSDSQELLTGIAVAFYFGTRATEQAIQKAIERLVAANGPAVDFRVPPTTQPKDHVQPVGDEREGRAP